MSKTVDIPTQLIIEHGAVRRIFEGDIESWIRERNVVMITGEGQTSHITQKIVHQFSLKGMTCNVLYCRDNTLDTINRLERETLEQSNNMIIGIGGGKVLDVAKVVGTRLNALVLLIPTAISSDAICSPVAVIRMNKSTSIGVQMPQAVVIDLDILSSCPARLISSGFGDLLSNKTALFDWHLAHQARKEEMNTFAQLMANNAVESFMNTLHSEQANKDTLLKAGAESLIMSGIAMSIAGSSRPCSGSEHLISHALDYYCGGKALHGEQVALGALISSYLQKQGNQSKMKTYYKRLGLPTHYEEIGYTRAEMVEAIRLAPTMRERYTVLDEVTLTDKQINRMLDELFPHQVEKEVMLGFSAG